jgi:hypothetical protein
MYLLEVHHGLFNDPFQLDASQHNGWTLITPCTADLPKTDSKKNRIVYTRGQVALVCPLLLESDDFDDDDYRKFITLMKSIMDTAQSGQEWPKVMHKQVHPAGDVIIERASGAHETYPIIQFGKKTTLVRVHTFISAVGRKVAFISHAFIKPGNSDRTPQKEQDRSKNNLKDLLNSIDSGTAQFIDSQGGRDGFLKLV